MYHTLCSFPMQFNPGFIIFLFILPYFCLSSGAAFILCSLLVNLCSINLLSCKNICTICLLYSIMDYTLAPGNRGAYWAENYISTLPVYLHAWIPVHSILEMVNSHIMLEYRYVAANIMQTWFYAIMIILESYKIHDPVHKIELST